MVTGKMKSLKNGKKKACILHVISGDIWAGAEVQVYQTLKGLQKEEVTVICVLFNDGLLESKIRELNIQTIVLDETIRNTAGIIFGFLKIIKRFTPDMIHVHHIKEHFVGKMACFLSFRTIPIVRTVHGLSGVPTQLKPRQHLRSTMVVLLDMILIQYFANALIAVSKDLMRSLVKCKSRARIFQIYNSIDLNDMAPVRNSDITFREKYGIDQRFWIGTAARLVDPKNLEMLIEAGRLISLSAIPFKISIFGEGPLRSKLEKSIEEKKLQNFVVLHGFNPDIISTINEMDVFVLCSEHEGLPMALLEAMSLSKAVVCTAVGGMKEVIENEVNGLSVQHNDVHSLSNALIRLSKDRKLAKRLADNARETIERRFTINKTTRSLLDLYADFIT